MQFIRASGSRSNHFFSSDLQPPAAQTPNNPERFLANRVVIELCWPKVWNACEGRPIGSIHSSNSVGVLGQTQKEQVVTLFELTGEFNRIRNEVPDSIHHRLTILADQDRSSSLS